MKAAVGKRIEVIEGCPPYFETGQSAVLTKKYSDDVWKADFKPYNETVLGDGVWLVGKEDEHFIVK